MKLCPNCGALCADDDAFCEMDGTELARPSPSFAGSDPPPSAISHSIVPFPDAGSACDTCGALEPDGGDGDCRICGSRLVEPYRTDRPVNSSLTPGMKLGAYMIRQMAGDRATASSPDGTEVLLVVGEPAALVNEAEVLQCIGTHRCFPQVVEHDHDPSGAFLALSAPSWSAQMLPDAMQSRTVEQTVAVVAHLLELVRLVESVGFTFQPSPSDLLLAPDGAVLLARVRDARPLLVAERFDARYLIESLSEIFLAPAIRGPTALVRLLVPTRENGATPGRTVQDMLAAVDQVKQELAVPQERSVIAQVCDAGLWRPYNQDATAIDHGLTQSGEPFAVMVVCDGVSSSPYSERASRIAAQAARDAMGHFARSGDIGHDVAASAVAQAIRAAHIAVCVEHIAEPVEDPPGTTIAAALVFRRRLTVGWVGDSRAYWFTARSAEQLTHDHSWVNEAIARGEVKDPEEVRGALAHTITRCLGPLEVGNILAEIEPDVRSRDLASPGLVLLCSDGLWNYAPKPNDIAAVIRAATDETNAEEVARLLVNYALARGGQDNVSVAVYAYA